MLLMYRGIDIDTDHAVERIKQICKDAKAVENYVLKGGEIPAEVLTACSRQMKRSYEKNRHQVKNPRFKSALKKSAFFTEETLINITNKEYGQAIDSLRTTGYIACFCERGDNFKMWSDYAEGHKGYVLEYDFETLNSRFYTFDEDRGQFQPDTIVLLVIYGEPYNSTEFVICLVANELLRKVAGSDYYVEQQDELWYIKGYIYKHADYDSEAEWRLITPIKGVASNAVLHTSVSGIPKAIYYGAQMDLEGEIFRELDAAAREKEIRRYRMEIKPSEMQIVPIPL